MTKTPSVGKKGVSPQKTSKNRLNATKKGKFYIALGRISCKTVEIVL